MYRSISAAILAASAIAAPSVAYAQDEDYSVNQLVVYGEQECPQSTDTMVTICVRMEDQYRIPSNLRQSSDPANKPWAERVQAFEMLTATGIMSCSPVGSGGETGCTQAMIQQAYGEKATADSVRFGRLIEEARAERLETIDEEAAETQRRVESLERQYMERLEHERAGTLPGEEAETSPAIVPAAEPAADTDENAPEG
ncbi:hypothetical protein [Altererythrobacter sp. ZODW24]|uniref:hypothetical protein n=1 Tax=Altererythrobacter sp. ZODW24 TaxID=2185142 RepID=UPI000DF78909|nr:hypothetical protein [Altererythrobacter sp. ZODW24]